MNWISIVILVIVAIIVFLAIFFTVKNRNKGCCGNCGSCKCCSLKENTAPTDKKKECKKAVCNNSTPND